jgi:RNA polymerase sigma-70 factor (ECF subfamily)
MARDEDTMLVEACLRGERHAFDELVDRYQGPLFNATYRITGSVEDAMDATQSAFINAFEKLNTFDPSYRFFSWIYRIAVNQALNLISKRRPESALDANVAFTTRNPDTELGTSEASRHLQRALREISPQDRTVIVLKHFEGLSYREIGELLEVPEKTVKSRLFTARRRLREVLIDQGFSL